MWAELANLLSNNNDLCIGLLLKAKKIEKNEDFLGDIHLSLASLWQKEGYSSIAIKELKAYASHRKEKGWAVSDRYRELMTNTVSGSDTSTKVDFNLYISKAEDYVYGEFEWVDFVITDKWMSDDVELKQTIEDYIKYYNEKRIKERLGWLSPVQYRHRHSVA